MSKCNSKNNQHSKIASQKVTELLGSATMTKELDVTLTKIPKVLSLKVELSCKICCLSFVFCI